MPVEPDPAALAAFLTEDPAGPVVMLNLLRFAEGGRESYASYAAAAAPFLEGVGGRLLYAGDGLPALVAGDGQAWDAVLVAWYPDRTAFGRMVADPGYREVSALRTAALTEAVLQPTRPWLR
jgi:uncharacterized protein (DUF1330 family)